MAGLINDAVKKQVLQMFAELDQPVQVLFFGKEGDCEYCEPTQQLLEEVCDLSDKLQLSVHDIVRDAALAAQYQVDKTPGTVIAGLDGEKIVDFGVRFAGIPSGHEFSSLINTMVAVSKRQPALSESTRAFLSSLTQPVLLQVYVTPT
jgi:alkyl hydroperoxide reductase subunit AhpF